MSSGHQLSHLPQDISLLPTCIWCSAPSMPAAVSGSCSSVALPLDASAVSLADNLVRRVLPVELVNNIIPLMHHNIATSYLLNSNVFLMNSKTLVMQLPFHVAMAVSSRAVFSSICLYHSRQHGCTITQNHHSQNSREFTHKYTMSF